VIRRKRKIGEGILPSIFAGQLCCAYNIPGVAFLQVNRHAGRLGVLIARIIPGFFYRDRIGQGGRFADDHAAVGTNTATTVRSLIACNDKRSRCRNRHTVRNNGFQRQSLFLILYPCHTLGVLNRIVSGSLPGCTAISRGSVQEAVAEPLDHFAIGKIIRQGNTAVSACACRNLWRSEVVACRCCRIPIDHGTILHIQLRITCGAEPQTAALVRSIPRDQSVLNVQGRIDFGIALTVDAAAIVGGVVLDSSSQQRDIIRAGVNAAAGTTIPRCCIVRDGTAVHRKGGAMFFRWQFIHNCHTATGSVVGTVAGNGAIVQNKLCGVLYKNSTRRCGVRRIRAAFIVA